MSYSKEDLKNQALVKKYPNRVPALTPIDETYMPDVYRKGYKFGTTDNNISMGYGNNYDMLHAFANLHLNNANINDFKKVINGAMGDVILNGNSQDKEIEAKYVPKGLNKKMSNAALDTYNKLKNLQNDMQYYLDQHIIDYPNVFEQFPLFLPGTSQK